MAHGKFYSTWQPLDGATEDQQTALVFGFLRHAPADDVLKPWLTEVLEPDQEQAVSPLAASDFWPDYSSIVDGSKRTQPEVVFEINAGGPMLVVIENKVSDAAHFLEQISREVVDAANSRGAKRVALIMIGPDLGSPYPLKSWEAEIREALGKYGLPRVRPRVYYSSWASLGKHIERSSSTAFGRYASDVVEQLKRRGLMGYEGAPMLDDLEMSVTNAVRAYNRIIVAARQLCRDLIRQPSLAALKLGPWGTTNYKLSTDGTSRALSQPQEYFEVSTLACCFRRDAWRSRQGVFIAMYLGNDEPELAAGAFASLRSDVAWAFAVSDELAPGDARDEFLAMNRAPDLPYLTGAPDSTFRYASRPWLTAESEGDVPWALKMLKAAVALSDRAPRTRRRSRS